MKSRMKDWIVGVCMCLAFAGCECVNVGSQDRIEVDALHRQGISWSGECEAGRLKPVVSMGPAIGWSFLPGAGQVFMAHKIDVARAEGRLNDPRAPGWAASMRSEGIPMLAVSWFPYIYDFTHPFGMAAVIVDVNRLNNAALREAMKRRAAVKVAEE